MNDSDWRKLKLTTPINEKLYEVIEKELNFKQLTKVQNSVIPIFSKNKDVIVKACTGSGKTLSYLIPLYQYLFNFTSSNGNENFKDKILSVILLPSRELSIQVFKVLLLFSKIIKEFSICLLIGGKKLSFDTEKLDKEIPNIIVGTPGRLFDVDNELKLDYRHVQVLILDEADKMLELGYEIKLTTIIAKMPKQRRTGLFSATINSQIENIIKVGMRNPVYIDVKILDSELTTQSIFTPTEEVNNRNQENTLVLFDYLEKKSQISNINQEIPSQLLNYYLICDQPKNKLPALFSLLQKEYNKNKIIIFFATCHSVDYFTALFTKYYEGNEKDYKFFKLHSKEKQKTRKKQYHSFLNSEYGILLTTDLSARGIDIPNIKIVIQYDPPKNEELFIHRAGRTARVGLEGKSFLLLCKEEENFVNYLEKKEITLSPFKFHEYDESYFEEDGIQKIFEKLILINTSDAWIYGKAKQSFVSYIRFYTEIDLKYIFDINKLDIGSLASAFSLLKVPRVREILGKKIDFVPISDVNPDELEYKNLNTKKQMDEKKIKREEALQEKLLLNRKKFREKLTPDGKKKNRSKKREKES
jgi:ATP-dependent RNA helicase DDX55/SPB4